MNRQPLSKYLTHPVILAVSVVLAVAAMYGQFLRNPLVFDDINFFGNAVHPEYLNTFFSFQFRWLSYASFEWTRVLFGNDIVWFRLGNLLLHAAVALLLFLFLHKLFDTVSPAEDSADGDPYRPLSPHWLAFAGTLIFALHPASVYAVAYLIQRSILMAALFTLAMWTMFLQGVVRRNQWWLIGSALCYLLAVVSKEHAITAPAVSLAMLLLLRKPTLDEIKRMLPVFVLYTAIAIYVVIRLKSGQVIGEAYEPRGVDLLTRMKMLDPGFDPRQAYPLSVLTQCTLFFKYFLIWILPNPAWMSIDMVEPFATRLWSWPHVIGAIGFVAYGAGAVWLLLKRGKYGLLGFGMLCPWLMFLTELTTVRIQESFVIYRSYLWMPGVFACLPFLFLRAPGKRAAVLFAALVVVMLPVTWGRLYSFSSPLMVWNDAARLITGKEGRPGVERIYHNRGLFLLKSGYPHEAITDFNKAISLYPQYLLALNDRAAAYLTIGKYTQALIDFNSALTVDPEYPRSHLGRAMTFEEMGNPDAALKDYTKLCTLGYREGCEKISPGSTTK